MRVYQLATSFLSLIALTLASSGDRLPEFNECVAQCTSTKCPRSMGLLALLAWDCPDECDYHCQQVLTDVHEDYGYPIHQYHGKWPFRRVLGIQEPASVLFSILNMIPHIWGYRILKRSTRDSNTFFMKNYYLGFAVVGVNTWVWSSVFHLRDLPVTEKLDYFSAIGSILGGLFLALVRFFRLDTPNKRPLRNTIFVVFATFFLCHMSYLSFIKFNYKYNMLAGVVLGIAQTTLWIVLSVCLFLRTRDRMDLMPIALVLSVFVGVSFELNDFSPYWRAIDAHSLWHASTVMPTYFWYKWMIHDLNHQSRNFTHAHKK